MRKLVYEIYKGKMRVAETASYAKMQKAKEEGYGVVEKLVEMRERVVYKLVRDEKEIDSTISLVVKNEWKEAGETIKLVMEWVTV